MAETGYIVGFEEQVEWLEKQGAIKLRDWVERSLSVGDTYPLDLVGKELGLSDRMVQLFAGSRSRKLQQRLRNAVSDLLWGWNEEVHSPEYFSSLLVLVGRFKVVDAYKPLLLHANSGRFKGCIADKEDIHRRILRVILALGVIDRPSESLCLRDIHEGEYASLCFRALYEMDGKHGIDFLPLMARYASMPKPPFHFHVVLRHLIPRVGVTFFADGFKCARNEMNVTERNSTIKALFKTRYALPSPLDGEDYLEQRHGILITLPPQRKRSMQSAFIENGHRKIAENELLGVYEARFIEYTEEDILGELNLSLKE